MRWVNIISSNVVSWYPKGILKQGLKGEMRAFWVKRCSWRNQRSFLAHKDFHRPKNSYQQNWVLSSNLQKDSHAQTFTYFFNCFRWPNESCYFSIHASPGLTKVDTECRYFWYQPPSTRNISCCRIPVLQSSVSVISCIITPTLLKRKNWSKKIIESGFYLQRPTHSDDTVAEVANTSQ